MDPRLVWTTWRRILKGDARVQVPLEPSCDLVSAGLTPDEAAIVADYAGTRAATDQTIFMYRNGLVRNALCALRLVPLSDRLLRASALDADEVAGDFSRSIGYRDDGPYLWRLAGAFVAYLARHPEFADRAMQDALSVDATAIALVRRLAGQPAEFWPDEAIAQPTAAPGPDERYVASRAAAAVSTRCDLTPWLENPHEFDVHTALEHTESHWLVYLPNPNAEHTYAELSARALRVFTHLAEPKTASQLRTELGLAIADVHAVIESLASLGAVTIERRERPEGESGRRAHPVDAGI